MYVYMQVYGEEVSLLGNVLRGLAGNVCFKMIDDAMDLSWCQKGTCHLSRPPIWLEDLGKNALHHSEQALAWFRQA
jgi:hypothetical protein